MRPRLQRHANRNLLKAIRRIVLRVARIMNESAVFASAAEALAEILARVYKTARGPPGARSTGPCTNGDAGADRLANKTRPQIIR